MPDTSTAIRSESTAARPGRHALAALAICLCVVLYQTLAPEFRRPVADAAAYAAIDAQIADTFLGRGQSDEPAFGMYFAPLYHGFVAAIAVLDRDVLNALHCVKDLKARCDLSGLTSLFAVQGILAALTAFFLFMASHRLTADLRVAWIALLIGLWSKVFSEYGSQILAENLAFFWVFLFNWMLAILVTSDRPATWPALIAGISLGAAALTRPSYLYLVYFMVPVIAAWACLSGRAGIQRALSIAAVFAAGAAICVVPWMTRNLLTFDQFALTGGQGAKVMIERLPYNLMTWGEWARSFVYWLPDFGDSLAAAIFDRADYIRLSWEDPASFYMMGRGDFFWEIRRASSQAESPLGFILQNYVFNDPVKHSAVTIALAWRGMFVARYVGLVGFLLLPFAWKKLAASERGTAFFVYLLPGYFMLGLYAFVSVNVVRYNEPLIAVFALVIAVFLVWAWDQIRTRRKQAG